MSAAQNLRELKSPRNLDFELPVIVTTPYIWALESPVNGLFDQIDVIHLYNVLLDLDQIFDFLNTLLFWSRSFAKLRMTCYWGQTLTHNDDMFPLPPAWIKAEGLEKEGKPEEIKLSVCSAQSLHKT